MPTNNYAEKKNALVAGHDEAMGALPEAGVAVGASTFVLSSTRSAETYQGKRGKILVRKSNRRMRERETRLTVGLPERLLILQQGKCAVCAMKLEKYHMDHIQPIARGGPHTDENIQLLCPTCNRLKGVQDPIIFMQLRGKLL